MSMVFKLKRLCESMVGLRLLYATEVAAIAAWLYSDETLIVLRPTLMFCSILRRRQIFARAMATIPYNKKVIAIVGTTGVGKSQLGVELAKALSTEVINADSMQVCFCEDLGQFDILVFIVDGRFIEGSTLSQIRLMKTNETALSIISWTCWSLTMNTELPNSSRTRPKRYVWIVFSRSSAFCSFCFK